MMNGCATGRTGTHVEANLEDTSRIENVGLCVIVEKGFAVRLQYVSNADQNVFGSLLSATWAGGFVGAGMAAFGEFSPDKQATRKLRPAAIENGRYRSNWASFSE